MTNGASGRQSLVAVASVTSALLFFFPPAWAAALVLGVVALVEIKQSGGAVRGRGLAVTGIVLSLIWSAALTMLIIAAVRGAREETGATWPPVDEYEENSTVTPAPTAATPATNPETPAKEPSTPAKSQ